MDEGKIIDFEIFRQRRLAKIKKEAVEKSKTFEKRNRVQSSDYVLMVSVAMFFDGLQIILSLIPWVGWILSSVLVTPFAWLTFYIWTSIKGWGISDSIKQFIVQWALPFVEVVPLLNTIPTWTLRVILQLSFLKAEDTVYNASGGKADFEKLERLYKEVA